MQIWLLENDEWKIPKLWQEMVGYNSFSIFILIYFQLDKEEDLLNPQFGSFGLLSWSICSYCGAMDNKWLTLQENNKWKCLSTARFKSKNQNFTKDEKVLYFNQILKNVRLVWQKFGEVWCNSIYKV